MQKREKKKPTIVMHAGEITDLPEVLFEFKTSQFDKMVLQLNQNYYPWRKLQILVMLANK